jgi:hypothetical protein
LHDAVKKIVKESLPAEKQLLYDEYKQKMAKLFDVREILRAKRDAKIGSKSLVKRVLPWAGGAVGAELLYEKAKQIFK